MRVHSFFYHILGIIWSILLWWDISRLLELSFYAPSVQLAANFCPSGSIIISKVVVIFIVFLFLCCFVRQKQLLGRILKDANIKLPLSGWNLFQKWNHIPPSSRADLTMLMGLQLIKILSVLPGTRRSNTVSTWTRHLPLFSAEWTQHMS